MTQEEIDELLKGVFKEDEEEYDYETLIEKIKQEGIVLNMKNVK